MALSLIRVGETGIPSEVLEAAHQEAWAIYEGIDRLDEFIVDEFYPEALDQAEHINWHVSSQAALARFHEVAPSIVAILDQFGSVRDENDNLVYFPRNFTTNYTGPNQHVATHVDTGDEKRAHISRVISLSSIGDFVLREPETFEEIERATVRAGQLHEFDNPAAIEPMIAITLVL